MTEVEKMRNGLLADMSSPELQVRFEHAKKLLARMRGMSTYDEGYRKLLEELVPGIPETSVICPPFYCDHGDGIKLGEHVFVNANCTFLDGDISRLVLIRLSGLVCRFTHRIIRWIIWKEEAPRNTLIRWRLVRTAGLVAELLYVPV